MAPQFVDFNADGFMDIVTGTYDGSPHVSYGSDKGFTKPKHILDKNGNRMILGMFWDYPKSQWTMDEGGHCTSAVAFDWDDDGDFDLLLGDYDKGHLYLRMNDGSNSEPKFSAENKQVMMGSKPFMVKGGMSAPQLVDWDGDGLTDIVAGSMKEGGVYVFRNTGSKGFPEFASPETLMQAGDMPTTKGGPREGCYTFAHDVDKDGDLDLLVGGYAMWAPDREPLTDEQKERLKELRAEQESLNGKFEAIFAAVEEEADGDEAKLMELWENNEEMEKLMNRMQEIWTETSELEGQPQREAGVWLYERK